MQNIVINFGNNKNKYKKILLIVILLPIIMILFNSIIATIFNLGTFIGTFLRYIYNFIVC